MACAIDVALGIVIYIVLFILLSRRAPAATFVGRVSNVCDGRRLCASFGHRYVDGGRRAVLQLVMLAYLVGVFVIQRGLTGSTLGTRLLGLVTVGHDGRPIGPLRALWRSVAGIVDYIPCCLPIVGIVTIFATTGHRRVGDMAAKSLVVERAHLGSPILVPGLDIGVVAGAAGFGAPPGPLPRGATPTAGPPTAGPPTGAASRPATRLRSRPSPGRSRTCPRCLPRPVPPGRARHQPLPRLRPIPPNPSGTPIARPTSNGTRSASGGCSSTRPPRSGDRSDQPNLSGST